MHSNCLVVLSNRKYSDLWRIIIENYKSYDFFRDNFDLFITTDSIDEFKDVCEQTDFRFLIYPTNISWLGGLKFIVAKYLVKKYRYVLFTFDDLFITKVEVQGIKGILEKKFNYYKLLNTHINIYNFSGCTSNELNLRKINDSYIGSLVFSIFQTDFFDKMISQMPDNLNPWEYEFNVCNYFTEKDDSYGVQCSLIHYQNLVIKGKVDPIAKRVIEFSLGNKLQLSREEMRFWDVVRYYTKYFLWHSFRAAVPFSVHKLFRQKY